ncbi:uncharacterized protein C14orf119 isoform X2 [Epargyreus clarus]
MSNPGLTSEAQLRYVRQWFEEFSELQREDFLPVLAAAQSGQPDQLAAILTKLSCVDKPVSLFQCRIKLFNEWFPTWAEDERDRLMKAVTEIDPDFGSKLQDILVNGPKVNGDANGPEDFLISYNEEHNGENAQNNIDPELENNSQDNVESLGVAQENIPLEIAATS